MTMPVPSTPVFDLRDVTYRYHDVTALDGLNLAVAAGPESRSSGREWLRKVDSAQYSRRALFSPKRQGDILR